MKTGRIFSNFEIDYLQLFAIMLIILPQCALAQEIDNEDYSWAHCYNRIENIAYGEDIDQKLDIYIQGNWIGPPAYFKADTSLKPAILFFHGGGWIRGQKEDFVYESFFLNFLKRGWNVVNIEYRRGNNTAPNAVNDALCAIRWISENADKYYLDIEKFVICGVSSGGHLALIAGLMNSVQGSHPCVIGNKIKICAIINWFGVTDILKHYEYKIANNLQNDPLNWIGSPDGVAEISQKYSPINYVTINAPPIISIHGDADSDVLYSQSEILHNKLDNLNVKNQLITLKGGNHMGFTRDQFQFIYEQIFSFLEEIID
jgi:acetyl esterase/lipase